MTPAPHIARYRDDAAREDWHSLVHAMVTSCTATSAAMRSRRRSGAPASTAVASPGSPHDDLVYARNADVDPTASLDTLTGVCLALSDTRRDRRVRRRLRCRPLMLVPSAHRR
jgi:hypothetical protein